MAGSPSEAALHAAFDQLDVAALRGRVTEKWARYASDVLPAWVAEMDFPLAKPVTKVLENAIRTHDLGYPLSAKDYGLPDAFAEHMTTRFGWTVDPTRVEVLSDVMQGVFVSLLAFTAPNDGILVQTPSYPPFLSAVHETKRRLVTSPLQDSAQGWVIDWDHVESQADPKTKLLLLCNPHNPSGRVFTRAELTRLAQLAIAHDLIVVADEIHADLVYPGHQHIPFASLGPEIANRTVTLTSASKTFNMPGLRCALAHFGSNTLHRRFTGLVPSHVRGGAGLLGQLATVAAWREGDPWLTAVLSYLDANRNWLERELATRFPELRVTTPEATYLAWLDCRALGLPATPGSYFHDRGRVALSDGHLFGRAFKGFARLNFATSRSLLAEILDRMHRALEVG